MASINFEKDWIIDFDCGHHLTEDESNFSSFNNNTGNHAIVTAYGGDSEIAINSGYHVPRVKKNLFSVANVVDFGNYLLFRPKGVKFLRNLKKVEADVVHSRKRVKDLFVLFASNSYVQKMSSNDNTSVWHARLGHLHMNKLKVMVQKSLVKDFLNLKFFDNGGVCEGCHPIDDNEPSCFDDAKGRKDWNKAMDEEMADLEQNETWTLVPKPA
ncbi:hypothetical protein QYF36_005996 [Acer negundo]|nr:hypothetical protein QYF36_005996 [Acer negundo]